MYNETISYINKMPSWMAWVQKPNGLIKVEGSASAFKQGYLD
jgi:hypothetical protein